MKTLKDFTQAAARPLPVVLLLDVSGSMSVEGKINALNAAVAEMLADFAKVDEGPAEIHLAAITFGRGGAKLHQPLTAANAVKWQPLGADGHTPMADAFTLARQLLEDRSAVPSRAYRPTLVLVSDGQPTDERGLATEDWRPALAGLLGSERASKAVRLAMAIGETADLSVLGAFVAAPEPKVFRADEARQIKQFFRWVTMTVTVRSRSTTPDAPGAVPQPEVAELEY